MYYKSETDAINDVKAALKNAPDGVEYQIVEREFEALARYRMSIAAIGKKGFVNDAVMAGVREFIETTDGTLKPAGTRSEIGDVDYEVFLFEAEVVL